MTELTQFEADIYIHDFAKKSVRPIIPYSWTPDEDAEDGWRIEKVDPDDLTQVPLEEGAHVVLDPAVWVAKNPSGGTLILTHEFVKHPEGTVWETRLLCWLPDQRSVDKLISAMKNAR